MIYYSFLKDVYLVLGHASSCIYDLNNKKLYSVTQDLAKALIVLINDMMVEEGLQPIIEQLIKLKILEVTSTKGKIESIKNYGTCEPKIRFSWVKVTNRCNLSCIHCFEEASPECSGEMNLTDFKYVIHELVRNNVKAIQIFGGEPLILGEKLEEMLEYSRKYFVQYEIFTNGTLINQKWIEIFKQYDPLIRLSLHSFNREDHERVTQLEGSYDKFYNGLNLLKQNEIRHNVSMIYMKGIEPGVGSFDCEVLTDIVRMAGRANLQLINRELIQDKAITLDYFAKPLDLMQLKNSIHNHNCFGQKIYVDIDLNVYPCVSERRARHGNLRGNSLKEILKEEIISLTKDKINGCKDCEYRYACYDCRADQLRGNLYDKPWYCTYDPIRGEWVNIDDFVNQYNIN